MTTRQGIAALQTPILTLGRYGVTAHAHSVVMARNVELRKRLAAAHGELQQLMERLRDPARSQDELARLAERAERYCHERRGELAQLRRELNSVATALVVGQESLQHFADEHRELLVPPQQKYPRRSSGSDDDRR